MLSTILEVEIKAESRYGGGHRVRVAVARPQGPNISDKPAKALLQTCATNHAVLGLHEQGHEQAFQPLRLEENSETYA